MKNHSYHLHAPLCVIFAPNSGYIARYAPFIWHKSPTNYDAHLAESIFHTRSRLVIMTILCTSKTAGFRKETKEWVKVENDMKKWGWSIQEYDENLTGGYIVALALDLSFEWPDYHFYRENGDGTWSCKWTQKDAVTGILDPQVDAFEHGYEVFCGYYYVIKECE